MDRINEAISTVVLQSIRLITVSTIAMSLNNNDKTGNFDAKKTSSTRKSSSTSSTESFKLVSSIWRWFNRFLSKHELDFTVNALV
ncbi:hypothetical protein ACH3XW_11810 [Acanthocheilonema viteae]